MQGMQEQPVNWIFLSPDYVKFLAWSRALPTEFKNLKISSELQKIAVTLRQPFQQMIADLGKRHNSLAWWASRISERNTMVCNLFLYCCYLYLVYEKIKVLSGTLLVVCESWAVLECLSSRWDGNDNYSVEWLKKRSVITTTAGYYLKILARLWGFGCRFFLKQKGRWTPVASAEGKQIVLISTFVDETCFDHNLAFHDRYFPQLAEWLEQKGFRVIINPRFINRGRDVYNRNPGKFPCFLFPAQYYRIRDYLFAIWQACLITSIQIGEVKLIGDINVVKIVVEEKKSSAFDCLEEIMSYNLPKRLVESGLHISISIDSFENMIYEKMMIMGFRKYSSRTKLVGFQHAALYPLALCLYVVSEEIQNGLIPDLVVTNGVFFREVLIQDGFPADRLVVGPALRYSYLWDITSDLGNDEHKDIDILVPLPQLTGDALELLMKVIQAFASDYDLRIAVKPHPLVPLQRVLEGFGNLDLPARFHIFEGSMKEALRRTRLVISGSSNVLYDVVAAGIPVVIVGRNAALDLNPLGFYPDFSVSHHLPEDIYNAAIKFLSFTDVELSEYRQKGREILRYSFNPPSEDCMNAFLAK